MVIVKVMVASADCVALKGMGWVSKTDPEETKYLKDRRMYLRFVPKRSTIGKEIQFSYL